jgi:hypothetical protein
MTDKHVRGELLVFVAAPKDQNGEAIEPTSIKLYLNYKHADGTTSTDAPVTMEQETTGVFSSMFDTASCEPGPLFWSIRTASPASAADGKVTIVANAANPDPL